MTGPSAESAAPRAATTPGSRAPAVYWFNPSCEEEVARGRPGHQPTRLPCLLAEDLESLPLLLAGEHDVVLVRRTPSPAYLDALRQAGIPVPAFAEYGADRLTGGELGGRPLTDLRPWGWSPDSAAFLAPLAPSAPPGSLRWHAGLRCLYSKAWSAQLLRTFLQGRDEPWLCDASVVGAECRTRAQVQAELDRVHRQGHPRAVVKAAFGQSGRHQTQVAAGGLQPHQGRWLERILDEQGSVVVEPWLDRLCDLSFHLDVTAPGRATALGWTHFVADARGRYRASWVRAEEGALPPPARGVLAGARLRPLLDGVAACVAAATADSGYAGPVGVDALVFRDGDAARLKPIVEVNPRFTMGRIALALRPHVSSEATALWAVLSLPQVRAAGFADLAGLAAHLGSRCRLQLDSSTGQVARGALCTADLQQGRAFGTVLVAGGAAAECAGLACLDLPQCGHMGAGQTTPAPPPDGGPSSSATGCSA
ncbi:MAG: hypothetical protein AB1505_05955 [Candidatus Latescibacterota bacterium]